MSFRTAAKGRLRPFVRSMAVSGGQVGARVAAMEQDRYLWVIQAHTTENGAQMLDEWSRDLTRLLLRATLLTLDMIAASGRDDGRWLETEATTVVDALFQLRLVAAIRAAGGRPGAEVLLRDLPEVSPALVGGVGLPLDRCDGA